MTNVISPWGVPTGEKQVFQHAVQVLRDMLEKAEAGEVIGVAVCALHHDGLAAYHIGGRVGGYSLLGAMDVAKADLMDMVRE